MRPSPWWRWSRRRLVYGIVAAQLLVLSAIVASQEVNRLFDSGVGADLELSRAQAEKDTFRGAFVRGTPSLELERSNVGLPSPPLQPGDRVLVLYTRGHEGRPQVAGVVRRGFRADPLFTPDSFSIPGTVLGARRGPYGSEAATGYVARIGSPAILVALEVPTSIPIADPALEQLSAPSLVRASLRRGFLGHRYLTDVRLAGRGWTADIDFALDARRDRLVVLVPSPVRAYRLRSADVEPARTALYLFDGLGKELQTVEVAGYVSEALASPSDGTLLGLLSSSRWAGAIIQLAQLGQDGTVRQRSPLIGSERVLGADEAGGGLWVVAGTPPSSPQPPFFVERWTFRGAEGPRLGPFSSRPRSVRSAGDEVWVLEPEQHRVTRLDRMGHLLRTYGDLNNPVEMGLEAGTLTVVEASRTQLSRFSVEGRLLWRVPRFQGLAWVLPEAGTGGGWVGASRFENQKGGVFRFERDGTITRLPVNLTPWISADWGRSRLAGNAIWDPVHGRLYVRELQAIAVVGRDGSLLKRIEGFRYAVPQEVRR